MQCKIEGCNRKLVTVKSGLCVAHYHRERRNSAYTAPVDAYHSYPSYSKAHSAVVKARGKASEHLCVNCRGPAKDWALMSLVNAEQDTWTVHKGKWFSQSIWEYSPMCHQDHITLDAVFGIRRDKASA